MARRKAKVVTKKSTRKVGRPRKVQVDVQEKPRATRRTAMHAAKKVRSNQTNRKTAPASDQILTLCKIVAEVTEAVRELSVDVRPKLQMVGELKRHVDDLRYRMEMAEERIAKGAGTSLAEFSTAEIARVLASKLEEGDAGVAQ